MIPATSQFRQVCSQGAGNVVNTVPVRPVALLHFGHPLPTGFSEVAHVRHILDGESTENTGRPESVSYLTAVEQFDFPVLAQVLSDSPDVHHGYRVGTDVVDGAGGDTGGFGDVPGGDPVPDVVHHVPSPGAEVRVVLRVGEVAFPEGAAQAVVVVGGEFLNGGDLVDGVHLGDGVETGHGVPLPWCN